MNSRDLKKEPKENKHENVPAPKSDYRVQMIIAVIAIIIFIIIRWVFSEEETLSNSETDDHIFTPANLAQYNGEVGSKGLYLSIMGEVFDVEKGRKHYGVGGSYSAFAGTVLFKIDKCFYLHKV